MKSRFEIGRLYITAGIAQTMQEEPEFAAFAKHSFARYLACDWGEMDASDKWQNDQAVEQSNNRIFAFYLHPTRPEWKIWIITEAGRSATTLLFPREY